MQQDFSIVFCWTGISGYMAACARELSQTRGVRLAVLATHAGSFDESLMSGLDYHIMGMRRRNDRAFVARWVEQHRPDVVFVSGWSVDAYVALARAPALGHVPFILGLDNPWHGGLKQQLARILRRRYVSRFAALLVPGERGWQYGRRLARPSVAVVKGLYGFDDSDLARCLSDRADLPSGWPKRFLFVGRYAHEKAIDTLVEAYRRYRQLVDDPWPLTCCGTGPLGEWLIDQSGITDDGFVQPPDQREVWQGHGVFVLPSRREPWGVVIAEACAAGLPIVCTDACGAGVELVRDYYNGVVTPTNNPTELARGFAWMHRNYDALPLMGQRSKQLAASFSAKIWAVRFLELARDLVARQMAGSAGAP